ncbi:DUF6695 family protein [Geofilum sp. OHC36d9]|uniref:DUF6695 family protein n=1 Tax=Geofilum sp. OHC36d9 TaxID=3458413 RepID=UPI004033ACDE
MTTNNKQTGFAIAIAWPETYCKQAGGWYEWITSGIGISKNNYYQAGHAALVLVDSQHKKCFYFDFGRYHSPFQHGRARGAITDPDLTVHTLPWISTNGKMLLNFNEILIELQQNPACHGEGKLHASYAPINFKKAYAKALQLQAKSPIPYGPFRYRGSNCSRFVNSVLRAGKLNFKQLFRLNFMVPLTPTPMNNVHAFGNQTVIENLSGIQPVCPSLKPHREFLKSTLPQPEKHSSIPENAQWLAGEGAGSWFHIETVKSLLKVTRYSPLGIIECSGFYHNKQAHIHLIDLQAFTVTYPSHCNTVTIVIEENKIRYHKKVSSTQKLHFRSRLFLHS